MKIRFLSILNILVLFLYCSCDKNNSFDNVDVSSNQVLIGSVERSLYVDGIPMYGSDDEFMDHYYNLLMDISYVSSLEESLDYCSFASKADAIYEDLSEKYTSESADVEYSLEEMWDDVLENQYYLSVCHEEIDLTDDLYSYDETGELVNGFYDDIDYSCFQEIAPALENNILRYMFNEKRMYAIGDYYVRYFDEGVVLVQSPSFELVSELQNVDTYWQARSLCRGVGILYSFENSNFITPIVLGYNDIVLGEDYIIDGPEVPVSLSDYPSYIDLNSKGKVGNRNYRLRCILNTYSWSSYRAGNLYNHAVTLDVRCAKLFLGIWWRVYADVYVEAQNYVVSDNVFAYSEYFDGTFGYETYKRHKYLMSFYELDYIPSSLGLRFIEYGGRVVAYFNGELYCILDIGI